MSGNKKDDTMFDTLSHELAKDAADKALARRETPDETAALDQQETRAADTLQRRRQQAFAELRETRSPPRRRNLPHHILQMTRDAVLEQLRKLESQAPSELQAAYRQLSELDTSQLRILLDDVEHALAGDD